MANTIALVDDDKNILTSVSMALEAEGFAVRCFSDGAEALKGMTAQPVAGADRRFTTAQTRTTDPRVRGPV